MSTDHGIMTQKYLCVRFAFSCQITQKLQADR
jgi:hypothetical protein